MAGTPHVSGTVIPSADLNDRTKVYDRSTSEVDVNTTTAETAVYSKSIGAGHMSTDRMLRLRIVADYLQNSGTPNITIRVKLGGTTILTITGSTIAASATRRGASLLIEIMNLGATNSQVVTAVAPDWAVGPKLIEQLLQTAAVDTSVAATLEVTVQHSASSASISYRKKSAILELV